MVFTADFHCLEQFLSVRDFCPLFDSNSMTTTMRCVRNIHCPIFDQKTYDLEKPDKRSLLVIVLVLLLYSLICMTRLLWRSCSSYRCVQIGNEYKANQVWPLCWALVVFYLSLSMWQGHVSDEVKIEQISRK